MIDAPGDRQLNRAIRTLAMSQFALGSPRVMYLGAHGEVQDAVIPHPGDAGLLLDHRQTLLNTGQLGAVAYFGSVPALGSQVVFGLVEVYQTKDQRSFHLLVLSESRGTWHAVTERAVDDWIDQWKEDKQDS